VRNMHAVTRDFEQALCEYTGARYAVAVDSCTSALMLALHWIDIQGYTISIPNRTYMSVPCTIIQAGGRVEFYDIGSDHLTGAYRLDPTPVWDCALRFTSGMHQPQQFQCVSFTGPHKRLKLGKGGAILHDDPLADEWFRRARMSGGARLATTLTRSTAWLELLDAPEPRSADCTDAAVLRRDVSHRSATVLRI
jgi:Predicted pyridoxal phosphate-dependent enzyme apparently involved in regulation of cell wall biogenesis